MAGYDKVVYEAVCRRPEHNGHDIESQIVGMAVDPSSKSHVSVIESFCVQCGMSLEEIRSQFKVKKPRKPKSEVASVSA